MRMIQDGFLYLKIAAFFMFSSAAFAAEGLPEGLSFDNAYLHPGKADFHYLHTKTTDEYNSIWWSPVFKGGFGLIETDHSASTNYSGGYVRPLFPGDGKNLGELILGYNETNTPTTYTNEFQGEYRFPFGLGLGGGLVNGHDGAPDIDFVKMSFRNKIEGWNYIVSPQFQEYSNAKKTAGGYVALYDDIWMLTYGNDGEQWRSALGVIAPQNSTMLRPALEALYTDTSTGELDGAKVWFVNMTLGYKGGFLSNASRLGRAMGPQGLEYGNPLGFLAPTWNRRIDVWELGDIADFRLLRTVAVNGAMTSKYEGLVFPFQVVDQKTNLLDYFYTGGFVNNNDPATDSGGVMGGFFRNFGPFQVSVGADYNVDTYEKRITVGLIDNF